MRYFAALALFIYPSAFAEQGIQRNPQQQHDEDLEHCATEYRDCDDTSQKTMGRESCDAVNTSCIAQADKDYENAQKTPEPTPSPEPSHD